MRNQLSSINHFDLNHFSRNHTQENKCLSLHIHNMVEVKVIKPSVNSNILPPEILEKILKLLNYKDLCQTELICRRWKEIVINLKRKALGKILKLHFDLPI